MILKSIALKIAAWFKTEAKAVEAVAIADVRALEVDLRARISQVEQQALMNASAIAAERDARTSAYTIKTQTSGGKTYVAGIGSAITGGIWTLAKSGEFERTNSTTEVTMGNINTAIQIAVALKTIDASLTAEQVQAATNAALAALYPAPAPAAAV